MTGQWKQIKKFNPKYLDKAHHPIDSLVLQDRPAIKADN